jgi:hypothetical protein
MFNPEGQTAGDAFIVHGTLHQSRELPEFCKFFTSQQYAKIINFIFAPAVPGSPIIITINHLSFSFVYTHPSEKFTRLASPTKTNYFKRTLK